TETTNTPNTANASATLADSSQPKREPMQAKPSQRMSNRANPLTNSSATTTGMNFRTRATTSDSIRCISGGSKWRASDSTTSTSKATAPMNTMAQDRWSSRSSGYQAATRPACSKRERDAL